MSIRYLIKFASFKPQDLEIIGTILNCPTMARILFPASLSTNAKDSISLGSAADFKIASIPREFYSKSLVRVPIKGECGVNFSITVYFEKSLIPNVINLEFSLDHLNSGLLTSDVLKNLFAEIIPVFQASYGCVDVLPTSQQISPAKYIKSEDFISYPVDIGWITYYGMELLDILGRDKFQSLKNCSEIYSLYEGIVLLLQTEIYCGSVTDQLKKDSLSLELGLSLL